MAVNADSSSDPLVSVVMPVYDGERFLAEAIESVLDQSYQRLELVLVDDGSRDRSWEIACEYARGDARVRPFRNERNLGIVATRNRAFGEAAPDSRYFAVMDCDDVCMPDRVERQVVFLQAHPEHAIVGGNTLIIDEHGHRVGVRRYPSTHEDIARVITRYNPIAQPTVMIRRSALDAVGMYSERFPRCQDYDLWLRMAARFKVANLDAYTLKYRLSATQGKRTQLRATLKLTIALQRQWLFHAPFFRPANVAFWAAEHALLLLPDAVVLELFKRVSYR